MCNRGYILGTVSRRDPGRTSKTDEGRGLDWRPTPRPPSAPQQEPGETATAHRRRSHDSYLRAGPGPSQEASSMTQSSGTNEEPQPEPAVDADWWLRDPSSMAWMAQHVGGYRRAVSGHRYLYSSLIAAFVIGLALQVVGYFVRSSGLQEPLGLFVDLAYALGFALWTGVVVVVFVQVIPEAKEQQVTRSIVAYETAVRERSRARETGSALPSTDAVPPPQRDDYRQR